MSCTRRSLSRQNVIDRSRGKDEPFPAPKDARKWQGHTLVCAWRSPCANQQTVRGCLAATPRPDGIVHSTNGAQYPPAFLAALHASLLKVPRSGEKTCSFACNHKQSLRNFPGSQIVAMTVCVATAASSVCIAWSVGANAGTFAKSVYSDGSATTSKRQPVAPQASVKPHGEPYCPYLGPAPAVALG